MATPSISEVRDFHPLVSKWLANNGYEYQHHWELPLGGIADFRAFKFERTYLVECKCHEDAKKLRSIRQLLGYTAQIPNSTGIFAVPVTLYDDEIERTCKEFNILYLLVEGEYRIKSPYAPTKLDSFSEIFKTADMSYSLLSSVYAPVDVQLEIARSIVRKAIECYTDNPSMTTIHAMARLAEKTDYNANVLHMDAANWVTFLTNIMEDELSDEISKWE